MLVNIRSVGWNLGYLKNKDSTGPEIRAGSEQVPDRPCASSRLRLVTCCCFCFERSLPSIRARWAPPTPLCLSPALLMALACIKL